MFTTTIHSIKNKNELLRIYDYLKTPQDILTSTDNIDFYINVEKSRNSIKNYDIHDEKLERRFLYTFDTKELRGKEEYLTDYFVENALDTTPCAYHVYQAFPKNTVTIEEAYNIGIQFKEQMWNENYHTVLFTHSNKENIHNHIIVIPHDGYKFNEKKFYQQRKIITKEICKKI